MLPILQNEKPHLGFMPKRKRRTKETRMDLGLVRYIDGYQSKRRFHHPFSPLLFDFSPRFGAVSCLDFHSVFPSKVIQNVINDDHHPTPKSSCLSSSSTDRPYDNALRLADTGQRAMVQNSHESKRKYQATRSSVCSFARSLCLLCSRAPLR